MVVTVEGSHFLRQLLLRKSLFQYDHPKLLAASMPLDASWRRCDDVATGCERADGAAGGSRGAGAAGGSCGAVAQSSLEALALPSPLKAVMLS